MKIIMRGFLIFSLLILSPMGHASVVEPGDGPYKTLNKGRELYVYDTTKAALTPQIAAYLESIHQEYERSFAWHFDEQADYIFASPNNQIVNAVAYPYPNLTSRWYATGSGAAQGGNGLLDSSAVSSWYLFLAMHETTHLYQFNTKGPVSEALHSVLGNSTMFVAGFVPFFVMPNNFLPNFIMEGNAVLNESRAGFGGRLYSGEFRALALAQLAANEIDPNRLINAEWRYPYGMNAYYQGEYFMAHLAAKYGVDRTNQFFQTNGRRLFNPLRLNASFREHFGNSYPQEIREYVREYMPLARKQNFYPEQEAMLTATFSGAMNHDADSIFFLLNSGLEMQELVRIDKKTGAITKQTIDLPFGKVFYPDHNGVPETVASIPYDIHHEQFSLYGDGHAFDSRYRNFIVNDQRAGKTTGTNAVNSQLNPQILLDGEPYDIGHSQPILDEQGNVYYFRQNGAERILFKNKQPVFKFDGFYGILTEVTPEGAIYFVANSDYGSTLYRYQNHEISRVLDSDRVIDARILNDHEVIAHEIAPEGQRFFRAPIKPRSAKPAVYAYGFPSYPLTPRTAESLVEVEREQKPYNAWRQMRYSSLDLLSGFSPYNGLVEQATLNFADPLQYQNISASVLGSSLRNFSTRGTYTYTRYVPQFYVSYLFDREHYDTTYSQGNVYDQQALLGAYIPVLRWRHYSADVGIAALYSKIDHRSDSAFPYNYAFLNDETYGTYTTASFGYSKEPDPPLSFMPWRSWQVAFSNDLQSPTGGFSKRYNTSMVSASFEQAFKRQIFASIYGNAAWAENHDIYVESNIAPVLTETRITRLTGNTSFLVRNAENIRVEVNKVLDTLWYSPRIPLGLDRIAPFVTAQMTWLDSNGRYFGEYAPNYFEIGYGVDLQLLVIHNQQFKFRLFNGIDTSNASGTNQNLQATLSGTLRF